MSNLIPFNFEGADIRVIDQDGDPWFVAKDAANLLEYSNTSKAINAHCKSVKTCPTEMGGQIRHVQIIPERDLYRLIMRSKLPAAEKFEEWVVGEVLPTIRKTGQYGSKQVSPENLSRMDILQIAMQAEEDNQRLLVKNTEQAAKIDNLEGFFRAGTTIPAFAKMLNGVNISKINTFCADELNWLYNSSKSGNNYNWRVRSYARDRHLTETNTTIERHGQDPFISYEPKLLQKGAKKLYQLYLNGELPMKKTWDGEYSHLKFMEIAA